MSETSRGRWEPCWPQFQSYYDFFPFHQRFFRDSLSFDKQTTQRNDVQKTKGDDINNDDNRRSVYTELKRGNITISIPYPPNQEKMNRPSRTEDDFEHPTWNQNPPFLAADLTTRQDLNGIANSRVHRSGASGAGAGAAQAGMLDEKQMGDMAGQQHARRLAAPATGGWPKWSAGE